MKNRHFFNFNFVCSIGLMGCLGNLAPRQNFIDIMNGTVGENIDQMQPFDPGSKEKLIDTKIMPNGNLENKYFWKHPLGTCTYIYEIDSKTNKILSWRIEGNPDGCIVNP